MLHGGKYHGNLTKFDLAVHIGTEHTGPNGRLRRVIHPPLPERRMWTKFELEQSHHDLHGTDAEWDVEFAKSAAIAAGSR